LKRINDDWWPDRDEGCHRVSYDLNGADIASSYCEKHDLVIQAGGNVGVWPRFLRGLFSNVWTFEPSAENYQLMLKNLSGLDVRMWHAALGARTGSCSMTLNPRNCGDDRTAPGLEVEVIAIDSLGVNPDLIYLDVQGDELAVLQGAQETLSRCKPIVAFEHYAPYVEERGDPVALLLGLGYARVDSYGHDEIYSTKSYKQVESKSKLYRRFQTRDAALAAMRKAPDGVEVDQKRMMWRHKNGSKTHFIVGD
jgi:FkbM family methyltransferase